MPFRLQLWDTAGSERFKVLTHAYYRGARIVILTFDITNLDPLQSLKTWYDEVLTMIQTHSATKPLFFVVGNKVDILNGVIDSYSLSANQKAIQVEQKVKQFCEEIGAELWLTSAKARINIHELFGRIAAVGFNHFLPNMVCSSKGGLPQGSNTGDDSNSKNFSLKREPEKQTSKIKLKPEKVDREPKRVFCCG